MHPTIHRQVLACDCRVVGDSRWLFIEQACSHTVPPMQGQRWWFIRRTCFRPVSNKINARSNAWIIFIEYLYRQNGLDHARRIGCQVRSEVWLGSSKLFETVLAKFSQKKFRKQREKECEEWTIQRIVRQVRALSRDACRRAREYRQV